jgi:hypothetical protein
LRTSANDTVYFCLQDEVVAITEKVVLKVDDLISWIIAGGVEWRWGHRPTRTPNPIKQEEDATNSTQGKFCQIFYGFFSLLLSSVQKSIT